MGFYGQVGNIVETHFQFDKIYDSRQAMEAELLNGTDNVFAGRFVLIEYDQSNHLSLPNIQIGYRPANYDVNAPMAFFSDNSSTKLLKYAEFTSLSNLGYPNPPAADSSIYENYYFKKDDYFFKMPSDPKYYSVDNYSNYFTPTTEDAGGIVGTGWIVREYLTGNVNQSGLTGEFYRCIGPRQDDPTLPEWSHVGNEDELVFNYLINYKADQDVYGADFDERGYNATVWQKVYSDGKGRFIQVARLECTPPKIDLYPEPPSLEPSAPFLDELSTDQLYRIHVPTHWGLQIKPFAETAEDDDEDSGQIAETSNIISDQSIDGRPAEIYMNLGGPLLPQQQLYHVTESHVDEDNKNEILLSPTGKSGKKYDGVEQADTLELSIHLPIVGNMIDAGYDLIYGKKPTIDEETGEITSLIRPRDIEWYSATSTDLEKQEGNALLGGKTYDLKTLAGTINTAHQIIGQIVYDLPSWPETAADKQELSDRYLYRYNDKYYRRGIQLEEVDTIEGDFEYKPSTVPIYEQDSNFPGNKYFIRSGSTFVEATSWDASTQYYLKNIKNNLYQEVTLEHFIPGEYYLNDGDNYICDYESEYPTYPDSKYYKIPNYCIRTYYHYGDQPSADYPYVFNAEYTANGRFYTYDNEQLTPCYSATPSANITYYTVGATALNNDTAVYYYYPGIYYYQETVETENGSLTHFVRIDDTIEEFPSRSYPNYFRLQFSTTPQYGLDAQGNVIQYYPIVPGGEESIPAIYSFKNNAYVAIEENPLTGENEPKYQHLFVRDETTGAYIPFSAINNLGIIDGRSPYAYRRKLYELNIISYDSNTLFLPGAYYYASRVEVGANTYTSYLKDTSQSFDSQSQWYLIIDPIEIDPLVTPFYLPDKYWYMITNDEFMPSHTYIQDTVYYSKKVLYVKYDRLGQCPSGFKWNDYALYIPPSITLASYKETVDLIEIDELGKDSNSLYGLLLALHKLYSADNEKTRSVDTVRGAYNMLLDMLYQIKQLKPQRLLYVNNFGQIDSLDVGIGEQNRFFMADTDGHLRVISLSELKTLLQNA